MKNKYIRLTVILLEALLISTSLTACAYNASGTAGIELVEMQMVYEENPAFFFKDMKLIWGDSIYYVAPMNNTGRGKEIGYATDETSTWRIFELKGHRRDYLLAVESEDVWRVMSVNAPEEPFRQYILKDATDEELFSKTRSVTLYKDGTAMIAESPLSSFMLAGEYFYTFTDDELLIHYEGDNIIARFAVIDDNTIAFKEATIPLRADVGVMYIDTAYTDLCKKFKEAPSLEVNLVEARLPEQRLKAAQLTTSWEYIDENGNSTGYKADSNSPLHLNDYSSITLQMNGESGEIELNFSDNYPPQTISVRRWDAVCAGSYSVDVWKSSENIAINGNKALINDDGNDYIYEVHAQWEQGNSFYAFRVNGTANN